MKKAIALAVVLLTATALIAHPHFQKTTSAKLSEDVEVSLAFFTVPANMEHVAKISGNCLPLWVDQGDGGVVGSTKD